MIRPRLDNYENKPGYVYPMRSHDKFKIGKSGWPQDRASGFRTANPDIDLLEDWCVLDMASVEATLHRRFAASKVEDAKEWFRLSEVEIEFLRALDDYALGKWVRDTSCGTLDDFKRSAQWGRITQKIFLMFSIPDAQTVLLTRFDGRKPTRNEMLALYKSDRDGFVRSSRVMRAEKTGDAITLSLYEPRLGAD